MKWAIVFKFESSQTGARLLYVQIEIVISIRMGYTNTKRKTIKFIYISECFLAKLDSIFLTSYT